MNNKFRSLLVAGLFAVGITAAGTAVVAAHSIPDGAPATQAEPTRVNDVDNAEVGQTGDTGETATDNKDDGQKGQVGESVNDNKDDAQKGQTGEIGESVNDNKDQKDAGNHDDGLQGQSGDQK